MSACKTAMVPTSAPTCTSAEMEPCRAAERCNRSRTPCSAPCAIDVEPTNKGIVELSVCMSSVALRMLSSRAGALSAHCRRSLLHRITSLCRVALGSTCNGCSIPCSWRGCRAVFLLRALLVYALHTRATCHGQGCVM